jgi:hydrogenase maturation protease
VDAVPRGQPPGTIYVIEPDPAEVASVSGEPPQPGEVLIDAHSMDPVKVLRLVRAMGGKLQRILLVGCEPTPFDPELDLDITMSPRVQAAVSRAIETIRELIEKIRRESSSDISAASVVEPKGADSYGPSIATV